MRTPAGIECKYFYGNYFRGKKQEECRLFTDHQPDDQWAPELCKTCPVPGILRANACENMVLKPRVNRGFLGLHRRVEISAFCKLQQKNVEEPYVGCGRCHPDIPLFKDPS